MSFTGRNDQVVEMSLERAQVVGELVQSIEDVVHSGSESKEWQACKERGGSKMEKEWSESGGVFIWRVACVLG